MVSAYECDEGEKLLDVMSEIPSVLGHDDGCRATLRVLRPKMPTADPGQACALRRRQMPDVKVRPRSRAQCLII